MTVTKSKIADPETTAPFTQQVWVCVGRKVASDLLGYLFRPLVDGVLQPPLVVAPKGLSRVLPGGVYRLETNGKQVRHDTIEFLEMWHDTGRACQWQTQERAALAAFRAAKRSPTGERDVIRETLAPLRALYQQAGPLDRLAIEIVVLDEIRRT